MATGRREQPQDELARWLVSEVQREAQIGLLRHEFTSPNCPDPGVHTPTTGEDSIALDTATAALKKLGGAKKDYDKFTSEVEGGATVDLPTVTTAPFD